MSWITKTKELTCENCAKVVSVTMEGNSRNLSKKLYEALFNKALAEGWWGVTVTYCGDCKPQKKEGL